MKKNKIIKCDVLVIGAGMAGSVAALELSKDRSLNVIVAIKSSDIGQSSTSLAQGGIIGRGVHDSKEKLMKDILMAGDGLCNEKAVEVLAQEGPKAVEEILIKDANVEFTKKNGSYDLTREAAHSESRILYKNDHTGEEIEKKLIGKISSKKNISILSDHTLIDLVTFPHHATDERKVYEEKKCAGCYLLENKTGKVRTVLSKKVILATGGVGRVYQRTTNPGVATGDGLAAAQRAGADIINAEYIQFHPTSLYHRDLDNFLISESMRGEGGVLKNHKGKKFMKKYDRRGSLAPRDIVARGIYSEMLKTKCDYVYLDIAGNMKAEEIIKRFPLIYGTCLDLGLDITKKMIPVAPTAHYFCGGIKVDLEGRTSIRNLYAAGEVSCTGLHGANRLASTSLLEGLVWGARAAKNIRRTVKSEDIVKESEVKKWIYLGRMRSDAALIRQDWSTIRSIMWNYVGIVRTEEGLERAVLDLEYLKRRIEKFYRNVELSRELLELRSGVQTALIIAQAAKKNRASRGCHYVKSKFKDQNEK